MSASNRILVKTLKVVMKSYRVQLPARWNLPLRLRPWFLLATVVIMLLLAFLGFTNFSHSLPLNDKALHFLCFCIATGVFYFIFDVDEDSRRHWFWRNAALILTGFVCFFCGGVLSEVIQSLLPYKEFQVGDILANFLGSSIGLLVSYHLERYYRTRREIARLYQPIDSGSASDEDDEDEGFQLLPSHNSTKTSKARLGNVWDAREELFGIGGDSDDEETPRPSAAAPVVPPSAPNSSAARTVPKVYVTPA
ncbi:hypothetical protein MKEN_01197300 [Mycena kentingensis (nom. inval.)]|nr:hypothetical protein MKEN_01197300 [Mycena kentingensis (nom. inval.)]